MKHAIDEGDHIKTVLYNCYFVFGAEIGNSRMNMRIEELYSSSNFVETIVNRRNGNIS